MFGRPFSKWNCEWSALFAELSSTAEGTELKVGEAKLSVFCIYVKSVESFWV